jgi:PleD family two-component response regulator
MDIDSARSRFDEMQRELDMGPTSGTFSVGFAALEPDETLDDLIDRADAALREARKR